MTWEREKLPQDETFMDYSNINLLKNKFKIDGGIYKRVQLQDLFEIKANPQLDKGFFRFTKQSKYPYFTRTEKNNGILGYVDYLDEEHLIKGNSLSIGMIAMQFFIWNMIFMQDNLQKLHFLNLKNSIKIFQNILLR